MNQFPPGSWVYHWGRFDFFRKFMEIFAAQGAPPVLLTSRQMEKSWIRKVFIFLHLWVVEITYRYIFSDRTGLSQKQQHLGPNLDSQVYFPMLYHCAALSSLFLLHWRIRYTIYSEILFFSIWFTQADSDFFCKITAWMHLHCYCIYVK